MSLDRYLVDNNVLSRISREQRRSQFFRDRCRLSTEVLHEASGFPDIEELRKLEYKVDADVLVRVRSVMATLEPGDFKLVDLYRNQGNADPLLIASALQAMERSTETLFHENWSIVSDDAAVRAKATEFGIESLGYGDFVSLLPHPDVQA